MMIDGFFILLLTLQCSSAVTHYPDSNLTTVQKCQVRVIEAETLPVIEGVAVSPVVTKTIRKKIRSYNSAAARLCTPKRAVWYTNKQGRKKYRCR
jgi:acetylglutamate kinase